MTEISQRKRNPVSLIQVHSATDIMISALYVAQSQIDIAFLVGKARYSHLHTIKSKWNIKSKTENTKNVN